MVIGDADLFVCLCLFVCLSVASAAVAATKGVADVSSPMKNSREI